MSRLQHHLPVVSQSLRGVAQHVAILPHGRQHHLPVRLQRGLREDHGMPVLLHRREHQLLAGLETARPRGLWLYIGYIGYKLGDIGYEML